MTIGCWLKQMFAETTARYRASFIIHMLLEAKAASTYLNYSDAVNTSHVLTSQQMRRKPLHDIQNNDIIAQPGIFVGHDSQESVKRV
jgi:hypothetical protein